MSTLSIRIPDSIHNRIKLLAKTDHISINQFVTTAMAEKISAIETEVYLTTRGNRSNKKNYLKVLSKVENTKPEIEEDLVR